MTLVLLYLVVLVLVGVEIMLGAAGLLLITSGVKFTDSVLAGQSLTVFLITHDLDTLYSICDRVAVLADKKVIAVGTIDELLALDHPWIQEYFNGPRGRAATAAVTRERGKAAAEKQADGRQ